MGEIWWFCYGLRFSLVPYAPRPRTAHQSIHQKQRHLLLRVHRESAVKALLHVRIWRGIWRETSVYFVFPFQDKFKMERPSKERKSPCWGCRALFYWGSFLIFPCLLICSRSSAANVWVWRCGESCARLYRYDGGNGPRLYAGIGKIIVTLYSYGNS